VRVVPNARWGVQVGHATDDSILEQALLLGLCTAFQFDPARRALRAGGLLRMNAYEVRALLGELIDENPFATRAVLKILAVEFTETVPTLAVTAEERPRLLINLEFVREHCRTAEHVKAVLCREFLHVLLRHTSLQGPLTPARHLALDAVINAIIHRALGEAYSGLMSEYYKDAWGLMQLLRPMAQGDWARYRDRTAGGLPPCWQAWVGLSRGRCSPTTRRCPGHWNGRWSGRAPHPGAGECAPAGAVYV
jgi:hypothetical protein